MRTQELLSQPESIVVGELKRMKLKALERHAVKMLTKLGQPNYREVLALLIRAIPKLDGNQIDKLAAVKNIIRTSVSTASNDSDIDAHIIERLSVLLTLIVSRKLEKIMTNT